MKNLNQALLIIIVFIVLSKPQNEASAAPFSNTVYHKQAISIIPLPIEGLASPIVSICPDGSIDPDCLEESIP